MRNISAAVSTIGHKTKKKNASCVLVTIPEPCATILNILDAKKDVVVQNKSKIDISNYGNIVTAGALKKSLVITDDVKSPLNSKNNFNAITKKIMSNGVSVLVNSEKMLNFESALQDEIKINNFTTELLTSLDTKHRDHA